MASSFLCTTLINSPYQSVSVYTLGFYQFNCIKFSADFVVKVKCAYIYTPHIAPAMLTFYRMEESAIRFAKQCGNTHVNSSEQRDLLVIFCCQSTSGSLTTLCVKKTVESSLFFL